MSKFIKIIVSLSLMVFASHVSAAPLSGNAIVDSFSGIPIEGDINIQNNTMSVNDWVFLGNPMSTNNVELLEPGSYTRITGDVTVPVGHVGAHIELAWNGVAFYTYMVWDVSNGGATYTIIDSDGDGKPGHVITNGGFLGITMYYEFETEPVDPSEPNVYLSLSVDGGLIHECTGDSSANIIVNAMPSLVGGAELDSITWTVDAEDAGTGLSINENLSLGSHVIEATAMTTTGESDFESVTVEVKDTTRPVIALDFLDAQGNSVESASPGKYVISMAVTDTCDPDPQITSSTATPTSLVSDGDVFFVTDRKDNLKLSVTALKVDVSAKDASGRFAISASKTLILQ